MNYLFASDNAGAAHPAVLQALVDLPRDHYRSYGDDPLTAQAERAISELFDHECGVYFVYNGTGANVTALRAMARSYHGVVCTHMAHINEDEAGACEAIGGFKLLAVDRADGKLRPTDVQPLLARRGFEHSNQPSAISITQATEVGTVYTPAETAALGEFARAERLHVHVDGARLANAVVALADEQAAGDHAADKSAADKHPAGEAPGNRVRGSQGANAAPAAPSFAAGALPTAAPASPAGVRAMLRRVTVEAGVDAISFGATKNGLAFGEAVVFFNRDLDRDARYIRKQTTQLHSKMRYTAAQFLAYLADTVWIENARHANQMARYLARRLKVEAGVETAHPVEANGVFAIMEASLIDPLQREFGFYTWDESRHVVRLMLSYDTPPAFVDAFVARVVELKRNSCKT